MDKQGLSPLTNSSQARNRRANGRTRTGRSEEKPAESKTHAGNPRLVVALMRHRPLAEGPRVLLGQFDEVSIGRGATQVGEPTGRRVSLTIEDDEISGRHVRLGHVVGGWEIEDLGSKNGTYVNGARIRSKKLLRDGDVIEIGLTLLIFRQDSHARSYAPVEGWRLDAFRTFSPELEARLERLGRIVRTREPVLVRGESGTGKELIANAIHAMSGRPGQLCTFNCAGPPSSLIASELFGYKRGAFTGAHEDSVGHVRSAHRGTLFLDEIGDLPLEVQGTLLRVLQEREVPPLGSSGPPIPVDIRVVCATNRDLKTMIKQGTFRRDLYQRLAGFEVPLTSLRERREDIGLLATTMLRRMGDEAANVTFHRDTAWILLAYDYPGNVRELENAVRLAAYQAGGGEIRVDHLPDELQGYERSDNRRPEGPGRDQVIAALLEEDGNVTAVARRFGKLPNQVYRWCEYFGIDIESFRRKR